MDDFCGGPFWDWNQTWYSENPDLTVCFEQTVLIWIPCAFLWLLAGLDVYYALISRARNIPWSPLNIAKLAVIIILMLLQLCELGYSFYDEQNGRIVYPVDRYTPIIRILTFGLALFLLLFTKIKGVRSSAVQFLFWFLIVVCEAVGFRTAIRNYVSEHVHRDVFHFIIIVTYFPLLIAQLLLQCWADVPPEYSENIQINERPCPEEECSYLSRLTFFWFESLAWKGYRKPLEYSDLWDLNSEDKSKAQVPIFDKHWNKALAKSKMIPEPKASFRKTSGSVDFKNKSKKAGKPEVSVFPILCAVFGPTFLFGALLKFIHDLLVFVPPQILKLLIAFVSSSEESWKGIFYATILLVTSCVQTLVLSQYFHRMFLIGMRLRTTLVSAIYRKALLISNSARKESTVGEIVNLMSVDAQRFMDLTTYLNMIWSAPLQIGLSLYFLWGTLGPSVMSGLAVMILLIPLNAYIASKVKKYQINQMKYKDQRVKLMNEILSGVKVLKLYAWEPSFADQVMKLREKEIKVLKQAAYLNAGTAFIWTCAPFLVAVLTFTTYVLLDDNNILDAEKAFVALSLFNVMRMPMSMLPMLIVAMIQVAVASFASYVLSDENNVLDAEKAFVSLSYFNILRFPLSMLPMMISSMIQASVSLKRVNKYMNADEIDPNAVAHDSHDADPVVIENGSFAWEDDKPTLKNINLRVKEGSLVAIVGTVGSGKSSLLSCVLGELEKLTGRVNTRGSIAYVAQQAWIQNSTLRENILFGRHFDPPKYDKVVESCALKPDLEILPAGDRTEIGEKGINLSGGQKQRVSLARACYNNADVYLLDDPLSAVDSHVGKHIFDKVLGPKGMLKRKTRLLVTHSVVYLEQMDNIVVMKDGEISEIGTFRELLQKKGAFADFLVQHMGNNENEDSAIIEEIEGVIGSREEIMARQRSRLSESGDGAGDHVLTRQLSTLSHESGDKSTPLRRASKTPDTKQNAVKEKLIEAEKTETGSVKFSVYIHYLKAVGWSMTFWTFFLNFVFQGFSVGSNFWLSYWADENTLNATASNDKKDLYLGVYGALGLGQALASLVGSFILFHSSLSAAAFLHESILTNVLRSPMSFFDTTPLGRILNRFAKDVDVVDNTLPNILRGWIHCFYGVLATLAVISYSTPEFIAVILPTGIVYYMVQRYYVATSRQLKRLESVSRSPIYSHFGETLTGAPTIRAYSMQDRFILESESKVDHNQVSYYPSIVSNRWLAVRLETIGNIIIFFAALFAVLGRSSLSPGLVGLSISYALQMTQTLNWLVRMTSDVETNIVAVERIKEYGETPQEADWEIAERKPPKEWPQNGVIEFNSYQSRYREGLDLVLRNVTCKIESGEKIGIVGRTGAGKSSLTLGLFRIVEAAGGSIFVDGQNISKLGLHDVRGRLTIIPQDPVLFSGTLRVNLDPFNQYTDEQVWRALELAHLKTFARSLPAGLQHEASEGGENLSVGQRQLICLARALLRKTKILVLDEATAAVDLETDDLIQATIRSEFKDCTVLTIAHRLNTIMDSTRVIVLDKGEIREFDSPMNLLKNKQSIFYSMAKDAGLSNANTTA